MDEHTEEIAARGEMTGDDWETLTPEQRLKTLMAVQEAEEQPVPAEVLRRARETYRRHPYGG